MVRFIYDVEYYILRRMSKTMRRYLLGKWQSPVFAVIEIIFKFLVVTTMDAENHEHSRKRTHTHTHTHTDTNTHYGTRLHTESRDTAIDQLPPRTLSISRLARGRDNIALCVHVCARIR